MKIWPSFLTLGNVFAAPPFSKSWRSKGRLAKTAGPSRRHDPGQRKRRLDNEKAPPPVAREAGIRYIANSDRDQKKMREFPLFDLFSILNRHLPSKRRISWTNVLLDVKPLRPREGGRNQRAEVESCFPLSKLHLRHAIDTSRIDSSGFLGLRDGNRCQVCRSAIGTKAFQVLSPILWYSIGLLPTMRVRSPLVISLT